MREKGRNKEEEQEKELFNRRIVLEARTHAQSTYIIVFPSLYICV